MSGLLLRCGRRAVATARLLPRSSQPLQRRSVSMESIRASISKIDASSNFTIGVFFLAGAAGMYPYINFRANPPPDVVAAFLHTQEHHDDAVEEKRNPEAEEELAEKPEGEKPTAEKMYEDHLKVIEEKYEEDLKVAKDQVEKSEEELKVAVSKADDNEAQVRSLKKELENELANHVAELKTQADAIAAKFQEEIESLRNELSAKAEEQESRKEKLRLVNEVTELKHQIESLGLKGSDLDKSYLLQKLATVMGVFAFESAMMNGEPLEKQTVFLSQGGDALIDAAISSLPEVAIKSGSLTPAELQSRFVDSKARIKELALVSSNGGGEVSDSNGSGDVKVEENGGGLESVLDEVESLIKQSNLVDASKKLEEAVQGTGAESVAAEWAAQARLRASVEQVHKVLQAHAASISMSLA